MPSALACCLSDGGGICACGRDKEGLGWEHNPLESKGPSFSAEDASDDIDLDRVEGEISRRARKLGGNVVASLPDATRFFLQDQKKSSTEFDPSTMNRKPRYVSKRRLSTRG